MNMEKVWKLLPVMLVAGTMGTAHAKLPPAPPVDPAKAEEAKAKAAAAAKKEADALAKAQDRAVDNYKKEHGIKSGPAPKKK